MIIFDQVTKEFPGGTIALDKVDFVIEPKELVFVTGHSGAGKTTILRLLLREIQPTSGSVKVDKTDIADLEPGEVPQLRRQIGAAFQDFKLLPDWTAAENIKVGLEILDQSEEVMEERAQHLLELVGLKGKGNLFPRQLSGGELQRVVIARALAPEPRVLFADEPTGNLDEKTARRIIDLLKDINELGTTVIIATHDKTLANQERARMIELEKGRIIKDTGAKEKKKHHEVPPSEAKTSLSEAKVPLSGTKDKKE